MIKKFVSILIIIVILAGTLSVSAEKSALPLDKERTLLEALNIIIDDVKEDANGYVSEETFMNTVSKIFNVPFSEKYSSVPISYNKAIKVMLDILGYEMIAKRDGYTKVASDVKLTANIENARYSGPINGEMLIKLSYNCLFVKVYERTKYGSNDRISFKYGESALNVYHSINYAEGIVTGAAYSSLTGDRAFIDESSVEIDGVLYNLSENIQLNDMVGMRIGYYYSFNDDKQDADKIILLSEVKNYVVEILEDDISDYIDRTYYYFGSESNNAVKLMLDDLCDILYNGRPMETDAKNKMIPQKGRVKLIDNTNNGLINVVIIEEFGFTFVASSTHYNSADDKYIFYDRNSSDFFVEIENNEKLNVYNNMMRRIKADEINTGDSLTFIIADDGTTVIFVRRDKLSGMISEVSEDWILIDDKKHLYTGNASDIEKMAGFYITGWFDAYGRLFYVERDSLEGLKVGYVIDANTSNGLENDVKIKIFAAEGSGSNKVFKVKKRLTLNNRTVTSQEALEHLKWGENNVVPQLVIYRTDSEGNVNYLDTAANFKSFETTDVNDSKNSLYVNYTSAVNSNFTFRATESLKFKRAGQKFIGDINTPTIRGTKVFLGTDTLIIKVPTDANGLFNTELAEDISKLQKEYFVAENYYFVESYAYDKGYLGEAKILLVYDNGMFIANNSTPMLVTGVNDAVNDKGDHVKSISGYVNDVLVRYITSDASVILYSDKDNVSQSLIGSALKPGDVITFSVNDKKEISSKIVYYSRDNNMVNNPTNNNYSYPTWVSLSKPLSRKGDFVLFQTISNDDPKMLDVHNTEKAYIFVYDSNTDEGKRIYRGDTKDILVSENVGSDYTKTLIYLRAGELVSIFVYK